jgi:hypothetical protein
MGTLNHCQYSRWYPFKINVLTCKTSNLQPLQDAFEGPAGDEDPASLLGAPSPNAWRDLLNPNHPSVWVRVAPSEFVGQDFNPAGSHVSGEGKFCCPFAIR